VVVEKVATVAARLGVPRAQVALAWLLHQPAVTSPIVGVTKPGHLADAVAAADLSLSDGDLEELGAGYVPHAIAGHR
jgi:aryl-alcohol dehydrogenase-like predicted oxidoreductase